MLYLTLLFEWSVEYLLNHYEAILFSDIHGIMVYSVDPLEVQQMT